ncbi:MAG: PilW family protein [Pseudoxanthomonas sp.]
MHGFSLVELMVGLVLGLLVTAAVIGIFLSNQQTARATEGLSRVQENLRTAFELMARDLRVAGGNACNSGSFYNALTSGTGEWWGAISSWSGALQGYAGDTSFASGGPAFGSSQGERLAGSDALQMFSGGDAAASVASDSGSVFTVNASDHGLVASDVLLVCDTNYSAVFNATSVNGTAIGHPTTISYDANAVLSRFNPVRWYLAYNANGGTSLYRSRVYAGAEQQEEVASDVSGLAFTYLVDGASGYVEADSVSDWSAVTAVRIELTVDSPDKVGTDGKVLQRTLTHVVELRNRNA